MRHSIGSRSILRRRLAQRRPCVSATSSSSTAAPTDQQAIAKLNQQIVTEFDQWSELSQLNLPAWPEFIRVWRDTNLYFVERNAPRLRRSSPTRDVVHASLAESYHLFGDVTEVGDVAVHVQGGSKLISEGQARNIFCLASRDLEPLTGVSVLRPDPRVLLAESDHAAEADPRAQRPTRALMRCYPLAFVRVEALQRWGSREAFDAERARRAATKARRIGHVQRRAATLAELTSSSWSTRAMHRWGRLGRLRLRPTTADTGGGGGGGAALKVGDGLAAADAVGERAVQTALMANAAITVSKLGAPAPSIGFRLASIGHPIERQ